MTHDPSLPAPDLAEVTIVAATPEVARQVALLLRSRFDGAEQRSYPAGDIGDGTCLRMTVDTAHRPGTSRRVPAPASWVVNTR